MGDLPNGGIRRAKSAFTYCDSHLVNLILDHWLLTPICIAAATAATTIGIGGPVFLTPLFMLLLGLSPATAVATALFTQCFGCLSGTVAYWQSGPIAHSHAACWRSRFQPRSSAACSPTECRLRTFASSLAGWRSSSHSRYSRRHDGRADGTRPTRRATILSHTALVDRSGTTYQSGISDLLAPDGTVIHPRAAERTKFCSAYNRPAPEAVTSAHADVEPTGAAAFRAFLRHRSTLVPFLRQPSLHSAARQPAGTGSAQILRSISPKSRRFR